MIKKEKTKRFRIRSKSFFLTYPKVPKDLTVKIAFELLNKQFVKYFSDTEDLKLDNYVGCKEQNDKGDYHIHICFLFDISLEVKNPGIFDLFFIEKVQHGNYQAVRSKEKVISYILKESENEKEIFASELFKEFTSGLKSNKFKPVESVIITIAEKGQIEEAIALYKRRKPQGFIINHKKVRNSLSSLFVEQFGIKPKFDLSEFNVPENLSYEVEKVIEEVTGGVFNKNPQTLWVWGISGSGKTQYILSKLSENNVNFQFVSNGEQLKNIPKNVSVLVLDDYNWPSDFNNVKNLITPDGSTSGVKILYDYVIFDRNLVRIVIANYPPEILFKKMKRFKNLLEEERVSLIRRVKVVKVEEILFKDENYKEILDNCRNDVKKLPEF